MSNYPEGSRDYFKEKEDDLPFIQDNHFLESIKNYECPYDEKEPYGKPIDYLENQKLIKPYKGKRECTWCDFTLEGDYKLLAYTKEYPEPENERNNICPECGEPTFCTPDKKEFVCTRCGLVVDENAFINEIEVACEVRFIGEPPRTPRKRDLTYMGVKLSNLYLIEDPKWVV